MTTTSMNETKLLTWKIISGLLAAVIILLIGVLGVESYYLYRASISPVLSHSKTSPHTSVPVNVDMWDFPSPFASGNPWDQISQLHQQMDQLFNNTINQSTVDNSTFSGGVSSPSLDLREEKDCYTVRIDMPGADKTRIKVNVEGRMLSITEQRTSVTETKDNDKAVRSERSMAEFARTIQLPGPIKNEAIDAKYDNGILTLHLPKADQGSTATQVPVH